MGFVGVDTGHSSIMKVFPRWADHLGLPTRELRGHDVPLGAPDAVYRDLVSAIRDDESHHGALVTTHKIRVFEAARDLFDELDDVSVQCGEISSISKRDGRLVGGLGFVRLRLRQVDGQARLERTKGCRNHEENHDGKNHIDHRREV